MSRGYWPEGCNPPETCFTCRHPGCKNECAKTKSAEFAYEQAGLAPWRKNKPRKKRVAKMK